MILSLQLLIAFLLRVRANIHHTIFQTYTNLTNNFLYSVLLHIFSHLDDLSLWSASNVCKRWRQLIAESISNEKWNQLTFRRWPLFRPNYTVVEWAEVFSSL